MNNSNSIRINKMVQWVYVTTICYLILILSTSSSPQCWAQETANLERSPLYEARLNYHAKVSDIDQGQTSQLYNSHPPPTYPNHKLRLSSSHDDFVQHHQQQKQELAESLNQQQQQQKPKSYAFAYAVRDGERGGGGDDFSHKERREGKVTIGEYSVVLPDGRTQIVRYTSDSKRGFNADVTYEGEEKGKETYQTSSPPRYQLQSSGSKSPILRQQVGTSVYDVGDSKAYRKYNPTLSYKSLPSPSPSPSSSKTGPIFLSYPLKAQRPSLPPSIVYSSDGNFRQSDRDHQNLVVTPSPQLYTLHKNVGPFPNPTIYTKEGPITPTTAAYRHLHSSSSSLPLKVYASPSPNSLYGNSGRPVKFSSKLSSRNPSPAKQNPPIPTIAFRPVPSKPYSNGNGNNGAVAVNSESQASPYRPIPRGQRAGPDPTVPLYVTSEGPLYINTNNRGSEGPLYINTNNRGSYASSSQDQFTRTVPKVDTVDAVSFSRSNHNSKTGGVKTKSSLVPIEYFKAGPATKQTNKPPTVLLSQQSVKTVKQFYTPTPTPFQLQSVKTTVLPKNEASSRSFFDFQQPQLQQQSSLVGTEQIYFEPSQLDQQVHFSPVKSSVATYTKEYLGNPNQPVFESTSSPGVPVGRAIQPSVGGLVYIDALNLAQRSTASQQSQQQGIKEALSRLPNVSPIPIQTTNHPYEAGSPDFGKSVGYTPTSSSFSNTFENDKVEQDLSSNQLSLAREPNERFQTRDRDGIIREYLVQKKYDNIPGYESELI